MATKKRAADLRVGDRIITTIPGHAAFADRINGVRIMEGGRVHVDLNHGTASTVFPEAEIVLVLEARR